MQCATCATENPDKNRFCMNCGAGFEQACPACDEPNPPQARFCGACGESLRSSQAPPAASSRETARVAIADRLRAPDVHLEGERRQVTVLFCDLAGSTRIAEEIGAESYRELLAAFVTSASGCIHRYEGVVNQLAGDGFMALFGAPIAHDDDAARACHAALGIQAELRLLSHEWESRIGRPLEARIGLNTGVAIVGTVGSDVRMDYSAIGDTTNVAARIQAYASPGDVYLADSTRRLVTHVFETEEVANEALRGKSEATTVHRLVRAVSRRERRHQALRSGVSRYLGRNTELALLRERFGDAGRGAGQVLFVGGEAGIGKSRMLHELRRTLPEGGFRWIEGQCVSYGATSSYLPVIDLLRGFFDVEESDSAERIVEKVEQGCARLGGLVKDAAPFYRALLAVDPGDERLARMNQTLREGFYFEAIRDLVHTLAREQPVVLLVEDAHWLDQASETLLQRLFDTLAGARVIAIVTHRAEYAWPHRDRSYFGRLKIRGLEADQVAALAGSAVGRDALPPSLVRAISERSDGNPFFVEEVAKALEEQGLLDAPDEYERARAAVPATVQEVLLARLDRLDERARRTLQIAAVIGREFTLRLLERMADADDPSRALESLQGLELIYEKSTYPELAFMFKHALTHDVAYQSLLESHRLRLHRNAAEIIEELYEDRLSEFYETLAFQYANAELPERAAHYALLSGERAAEHTAPEAEEHFTRAVRWSRGREGCEETFTRAQIGLGDHLVRKGEIDAANAAFREALEGTVDEELRRFLRNKIVERRFIERDGVRLAYYVHGAGADGDPSGVEPYVLLHPLIQGSFSFQDLAQRLCQERCVIYLDPRGQGASGAQRAPGFDFDVRVDDAVAVLESLPYESFVLQGDSDGVPMALRAYHALPGRVSTLVLFGFSAVQMLAPDHPFGVPENIGEIFQELFLDVDIDTALENFWNAMSDEPGMSAWHDIVVPNLRDNLDEVTFKDFIRSAASQDLRPLLPGVAVPTLFLAAENDPNSIESVRYAADRVAGSQFAYIRGASHFATLTAIDTFHRIVSSFLRGETLAQEAWDP